MAVDGHRRRRRTDPDHRPGAGAAPDAAALAGPPPPGLPAHTRRVELFSEMAAVVEAALGAEVGGIRLAPGAGVTLPDGRHNASAALEVLVASHPRPLFAAAHHFRAVDTTLEAHAVPLHVARTARGGVLLDARGA